MRKAIFLRGGSVLSDCYLRVSLIMYAGDDEQQAGGAVKKPHAAQKKKGRPKPVQEDKGDSEEPAYRLAAQSNAGAAHAMFSTVSGNLKSCCC